jgi:MoaA/NifB/PqqE/SkfB family radical SAM enzyme
MIQYFNSKDYNLTFNTETGETNRWGATVEDDPQFAPAPEIMDISVSDRCNKNCNFCYRSNTPNGTIMTLNDFKSLMSKIVVKKGNITFPSQVALSNGSLGSNPELYEIMEHCRSIGVVPNITISGDGLDDYHTTQLVKYCGAISVSNYNKDTCYGAVKKLTDAGLKQCNIHQLISSENYDQCLAVADDTTTDPRLKNLNAIVYLTLKKKGRGVNSENVSFEEYKKLIRFLLDNKISFGSDSCGCHAFLKCLTEEERKMYEPMVDPCESGCFSYYISANLKAFPCSFAEGKESGMSLQGTKHFDEIWHSPVNLDWRERLLSKGRECPLYDLYKE